MNQEYQCIGENVFVKEDVKNKVYKCSKNIEDILIEENIIETLEMKKRDNNYLISNFTNIKKILTKLNMFSIVFITLIVLGTFINTLNILMLLPLLLIIPIEIVVTKLENNYKQKIKNALFENIALSKIINKSKKKLKYLNNKKNNDTIKNTKLIKIDDKEKIKEALQDVKSYNLYNQNKDLYIELYNEDKLKEKIEDEIIYNKINNYIEEDLKIKVKIKK